MLEAMRTRRWPAGLLTGAIVVIAGCSTAGPPSAGAPVDTVAQGTRTSEGGEVTAAVTWKGPAAGALFSVQLDTHSLDLDGLDLADAILRNDRGETMAARPWTAPKDGHHRTGELAFAGDSSGFFVSARWIEVVLPNVGGLPERVLHWDVGK